MLHFYENPSKVLGYQGWNKILIITLISSQKITHLKHFSRQCVSFFLEAQIVRKFWRGLCPDYFFKNADVCIPETPPPLMSANVCNWVPPPPLKVADVLCGRPLLSAKLAAPISVQWFPCPCVPIFNHYFYKKLGFHIHIQNVYFGLGSKFGLQRI